MKLLIFPFSSASRDEIVAIIKGLQNNKVAGGETSLNILKEPDFKFDELTEYVNYFFKWKISWKPIPASFSLWSLVRNKVIEWNQKLIQL